MPQTLELEHELQRLATELTERVAQARARQHTRQAVRRGSRTIGLVGAAGVAPWLVALRMRSR